MTPPGGATPEQVAAVLTVVTLWEHDAAGHITEAGKLTPATRYARSSHVDLAARDAHLEQARILRSCADDVRTVLDLGPRPSPLRDPLAR